MKNISVTFIILLSLLSNTSFASDDRGIDILREQRSIITAKIEAEESEIHDILVKIEELKQKIMVFNETDVDYLAAKKTFKVGIATLSVTVVTVVGSYMKKGPLTPTMDKIAAASTMLGWTLIGVASWGDRLYPEELEELEVHLESLENLLKIRNSELEEKLNLL